MMVAATRTVANDACHLLRRLLTIMITETCRIAVGILLLGAALAKAARFRVFVASVDAFGILRTTYWNRAISVSVVCIELFTGVAIIGRWFFPETAVIAAAMLTIFSVAVATALLRGKSKIPCGCMGLGDETIGWYICIRNTGFTCLLLPNFWSSAEVFVYIVLALIIVGVFTMNSQRVRLHAGKTLAKAR